MSKATRNRQAREVRVKLSEGDFHKLVSERRLLELRRLEAREKATRLAIEIVQKEIAADQARSQALFEALARKYHFDPTLVYSPEEATLELVAQRQETTYAA